ncbi:MAG TPA: peptidylprolyl isomerase [Gemmatimonadaceae bacterium]|nr:peptidylprolyl isomerase [Gemmatimonadaceae bacterium]
MKRIVLALAGAVVGLTACDSFKEAMTAHVDTAARAGSEELSVEHLATLIGESPLPLQEEVAKAVAQVWVNYQLLGQAAAAGDTLNDPELLQDAMWSQYANIRIGKFMEDVSKDWRSPAAPMTEAEFNQGDLLAAQHILFGFPGAPQQQPSEAVRDSVRREAERVAGQVTAANFAEMARRYSTEPGVDQSGGDLGVFAPQRMVPEFARAVSSLKPGEISRPVLTPYGYHIIRRRPFSEVDKAQLADFATQRKAFVAESTYHARVEAGARVNVRPNIAQLVRDVAKDPDAHREDETVLATYDEGEFTAGRLAQYIQAAPPQERVPQQIAAMPDSAAPQVVRFFLFRDLVLQQADSAKVTVDSAQMSELRQAFTSAVTNAWAGLGVAPSALADSAKSPAERSALAAARVDAYFNKLVRNEAPFVTVPPPIEAALHEKYEYKVNDAGITRALELAQNVRAKADSARAAGQPPTAVPMPGAAPGTTPAAGQPQGGAAPGGTPPGTPATPPPAQR